MLTDYEREILTAVRDGVDVYQHGIAVACRLLEGKGLVFIGQEIEPGASDRDGFKFGCIATLAGREALDAG